MKIRKVGAGWDISRFRDIPRLEDVEITPPPVTPSPPQRSKIIRGKNSFNSFIQMIILFLLNIS